MDPRRLGTLVSVQTVEYASGRFADVYGDATQPRVLLWHGMQPDARAVLRPLAGMLAGRGVAVVVPDWNSHAHDGGRADLLRSVDFVRQRASDTGGIVLVGWSLGGAAAAGLALDAERFKIVVAQTVCLAGAFMVPEPISGRTLTEALAVDRLGAPFTLLHGLADDAVPLTASKAFADGLERVGWPVDLVNLEADHGSIAGAEYDPRTDRYQPAKGGAAQEVGGDVSARIAALLGR